MIRHILIWFFIIALTLAGVSTCRKAGPYLQKAVPKDPWGQPYQYEYPGTHDEQMPDIWSLGPDMMDGTDDDVGNWVAEE